MKFINSQNVWCYLYFFLWPTRREIPVCCFTSWLLSILFLWLSCTLIQINNTVTLPSVVEFTAEAHKSVVCSMRKALMCSTVIPIQWIIKTLVQLWFQSVPVSPPLCLSVFCFSICWNLPVAQWLVSIIFGYRCVLSGTSPLGERWSPASTTATWLIWTSQSKALSLV